MSGRSRGRHDVWGSHAVTVSGSEVSTIQTASGQWFWAMNATLKSGEFYFYLGPLALDHDGLAADLAAQSQFFLPSGAGSFYGEAFNYNLRSQFTTKLTPEQFPDWLSAH